MIAILQKDFLGMKPGTVFQLRKHKEQEDLHIFEVDELDLTTGERFWLTKEFVLGVFEKDYSPVCWEPGMFLIV